MYQKARENVGPLLHGAGKVERAGAFFNFFNCVFIGKVGLQKSQAHGTGRKV